MTPPVLTGTASDKRIDLAWSAVVGAVKYRVRIDGVNVAQPTVTSYALTNRPNGITVECQVVAVDAANGTAKSNVIKLTPKAPTTTVGYGRNVTGGGPIVTHVIDTGH